MYTRHLIVESDLNVFSYLNPPVQFGEPCYTSNPVRPYHSAEHLEMRLRLARGEDGWWSVYSRGRFANNLAAVCAYTVRWSDALDYSIRADEEFFAMLESNNPHPHELTFLGIAMVRYNRTQINRELARQSPDESASSLSSTADELRDSAIAILQGNTLATSAVEHVQESRRFLLAALSQPGA